MSYALRPGCDEDLADGTVVCERVGVQHVFMFAPMKPGPAPKAPKRTDSRFDAKSTNAAKRGLEHERQAALTSPIPTRGRYYRVTPEGPSTIEAIAESSGVATDIIENSAYNRSRYLDSEGGTLSLGPSGPQSDYPLLWIPEGSKQEPPLEDQSMQFGAP